MKKRDLIIVSILLIIAAVTIEVLADDSNLGTYEDLVDFFAGVLFAAGFFCTCKSNFHEKQLMLY